MESRPRVELTPGLALVPLRLFLGVTFVYAGIQKLTDPGFLHPGAPTYIGTQLHGFASGTPGGFLLRALAIPHPELAGVAVAVTEIAIGLLAMAGFMTRLAAAGGMALNFLLFLTASWHTSPYFLGPDIVFTFAWLPFVIAGASGQPALDTLLERRAELASRERRRAPGRPSRQPEPALTRRALLAEFAGAAVAIAGVSALLKGSYSPARSLAAGGGGKHTGKHQPKKASSSAKPKGGQVPANAVKLGPGSRLPAGQAATYSDPSDGSPDILIRDSSGGLKAFSAVCTHAGCTVGYSEGTIICPCHGGEYSAETGEVIAGPPPAPLEPRQVVEVGGNIYAVPA